MITSLSAARSLIQAIIFLLLVSAPTLPPGITTISGLGHFSIVYSGLMVTMERLASISSVSGNGKRLKLVAVGSHGR